MAKTLLSRTPTVSKNSQFQGDRKVALHDHFLSKRWRWLRGWILPITGSPEQRVIIKAYDEKQAKKRFRILSKFINP